ncbi:hypothetical protein Tco_0268127 [Tanacetum coccineum]
MLTAPESSPSIITSSPSLSPQTHPSTSQQPPTPPCMQTIHDTEEPATMPHDSSQPRVQSLGSDEGSLTLNELMVLCTTLSKKVEDLQNDLKQTKMTYGAAYTKLILKVKKLEHKVKASKSRRRTKIVVSNNEEVSEDPSKQGRIIAKIDQNLSISLVLLEQEEPTKLVEDPGSSEKGEKEISNAEVLISTASAIPEKKTKKQLEQERLRHEEAIRLQEQINEEERQRIARDAEIAKQLQEEIDIARQEQEKYDLAQALELQKKLDKSEEVVSEADPAQVIDWSDPAVLRYHAQQNRYFSKAKVRKNMCMYLKNQGGYKQSHFKGMSYEDIRPIFERVREVSESVEEQFAGKEKEVSEEELKKLLVIVPVEEVYIKALQDMLKRFDRDDLEKIWDLVKKKFSSTDPTVDKEKVLWVELKRLFEPDDDDTLWKLQRYMHDPLTWKLYDTCGVYHVSTERGHDIFMLVENDYPLTRALMTVMLANKLQVDESLETANELLRKIFHQVNHKFRGGFLLIPMNRSLTP